MTNLINRLLGKSDQPRVETTFSADEMQPILASQGVDIETIGFPSIEFRHSTPFNAYHVAFKDVKMTPIKVENKVSVIISGKYLTQAVINHMDEYNHGTPGTPSSYAFEIKDSQLNIRQIK